ncbi:hypothetical protein LCGC14_0767990 [marine sediment metagenome]|uniref:Uncharacterized protein n=1 Tax=marine sediment metagenome TaxID=412755 RepID=A0A0F9T622_9ZZZZ
MLSTLKMVRLLRRAGKDHRRRARIVQEERLIRTIVANDKRRKGIN